jgi:hypothetical protein
MRETNSLSHYRVVIGDVNGQFPEVFQKIGALHNKNNFAFALVIGNLFIDERRAGNEEIDNVERLLNGKIKVPLPTYFALGTHGLPADVVAKLEETDSEICENLTFLGKRTTFKTSEGIRIVALGGVLDPTAEGDSLKDEYSPLYSENDAKILRGAKSADILITSQWPAQIQNGSKVDFDESHQPDSESCIADLCGFLKPRYHFSTSPSIFYEREPFAAQEADDIGITRFISLASYGNLNKAKWVYAFTLDPSAPPTSMPAGVTGSPFSVTEKKRPSEAEHNPYRYSTGSYNSHSYDRPRKRKRHERLEPLTQQQCFFCISNPDLAEHLITSIATDTYLATAKGPLTTRDTFASLPFPGHMLIIPHAHAPTLSLIADPKSRKDTINEMHRYRDAMQAMLKSISPKEVGAATWEVSRRGGFHVHWQWLPCLLSLIQKGLVEAAFKVEAENLKYPGFGPTKPTSRDTDPEAEGDFFRVMIWNPDGKDTEIRLPLHSSFRFDLQFGRRVMAKLLRLEERSDWHECGQSHDDEVADAEEFKKAFEKFDFSL